MSVADQAMAAAPAASRDVARRYRADIDGLRAVAVIAVVLTHAGIAGFAGGYVGVDIFFVISGFLITRNLEGARRKGRFRLWTFYGRRMRRTLPAMVPLVAVCLGVAAVVFMPGDFADVARATLATLALGSNIFVLTQTGYFDHDALAMPLLHTWSLGVEEQFYLLAPLLPFALRRATPRGRGTVLAVLFALSFGFCVVLRAREPSAAFFLMPARLWEFLVGCIVAEHVIPAARSRWLAEIVAGAAIIALGASIALFAVGTAHPGLPTLVPCVATAALIHVGSTRSTLAGRLLGARPMAAVGLISYSIYLWHWPMIVFARYAGVESSPTILVAACLALVAVSALSWHFVETPFRAPASVARRRAAPILAASVLALATASITILAGHGFPARFAPEVASVAAFYDHGDTKPYREGQCFITSKERLTDFDRAACLAIDPARRDTLLLGDSNAAHLWTGLRDTWPTTNFLQATASGCKPVLATVGAPRCTALMTEMFQRFVPAHRLDGIVLAALWEPEDIAALTATIAYLAPRVGTITVFGPILRYDQPVATLLARGLRDGDVDAVRWHELASVPALDVGMRAAIGSAADYISLYDAMCPGGRCRRFAAPGIPMQFDYHHLTEPGGDVLMRLVRDRHAASP